MRSALFCLIIATVANVAAAGVVLPSMRLRNGLTDEQYEQLFAAGKNPAIDANTARDWMYRAFRYENVKEWLETLGKTNNFAALAARVPVIEGELSAMSNVCLQVLARNINLEKEVDNFARTINTQNERIDELSGRIEFVGAKLLESYSEATNSAAKAILPTSKAIYNEFAKLNLSCYCHLNNIDNIDNVINQEGD